MKLILFGLLAGMLLILGCGGTKPAVQPAGEARPEIKLPERPAYVLGVGDKLEVRFPYYPGYNLFLVVRPDGMITVPHIGDMMVEGMTPSALQEMIRARYAEILTQPEVAVIVSEPASQMIFVFGEVRIPSSYPLKGQMTVLDAIAGAGGPTYLSRKDSIVLIRQTPDGKATGRRVDLNKIMEGRGENPTLIARDVIYVPLSRIGKLDVFVEQFFGNLTPAWFFYIYGRNVVNPEGNYIIGR